MKVLGAIAAVLVLVDVARLFVLPDEYQVAFTDGFETVVAAAGVVACVAAARRTADFRRAQWALVTAFFAGMFAADLHDFIVDLMGPGARGPAVLAIIGWASYLPLALLVIVPRPRAGQRSAWTWLAILDFAQITLIFGVAYFNFVYLAHFEETGGTWTTRLLADEVRNIVLTVGLAIRRASDPNPNSRRLYGWICVLFGTITLLHLVLTPRVNEIVLIARPAALMGIVIVAATWRERDERPLVKSALHPLLLPSWTIVLFPACGPLLVLLVGMGVPDAYLAYLQLALVLSAVMFAARVAVAEHLRDVSARALAESETRYHERLRQTQKMEAIGRLAGGIAHDFNNVLTVVTMCTQTVQRSLGPGDARYATLDQILEASSHASGLTKQLLAFSRSQTVARGVLDLAPIVANTTTLLAHVLGEDIELRVELDQRRCHVNADRGQLEQVIMNLAINARDAMPRGGVLTVALRTVDTTTGERRPTGLAPGPFAVLSVSDTGHGMSPEVQRQMFEPFFTTKGQGRGTGLGLSTVYGIVEQHGGTIEVTTAVDAGTTFEIYLPSIDAPVTPTRDSAPALVRGKEVVLVVDDEPLVRDNISELLVDLGYQVISAASGADALALEAKRTGTIDLLVTDVVMPAMSGTELAAKLRARRPALRVLFVSGYAEGLPPGEPFLAKPFTAEELSEKLREVLAA